MDKKVTPTYNDPVCNECRHMEIIGRARITGNNLRTAGPRGEGFCEHNRMREAFKRRAPNSPRMPGFIGYTYPGSNELQCKSSPRWCPLKIKELRER